MRGVRAVAFALALVVLCVVIALAAGCTPPAAGAASVEREGTLYVVAAGDTLKATMGYRVTGSPDSVAWIFTARNAPLVRLVRAAPPNGTSLAIGPANLIPAPALAEGDTVTVQACPIAYKKGQTYTGFACGSKLYQKPIIPPVVLPDSLTVVGLHIIRDPAHAGWRYSVASGTGATVNTTMQMCAIFRFKDNGKWALRSIDRADTSCARQYATTVGALQKAQAVAVANGAWTVGSAGVARQAALDALCIHWQATGGTIADEACVVQGAAPSRRPFQQAAGR